MKLSPAVYHLDYCQTHLSRVVCVGGDGMFSEILHGLVARTQTVHGVDQNQPDAELVPCSLRIGIIPAGRFAYSFTKDRHSSA